MPAAPQKAPPAPSIVGAPTSITAFVGRTTAGAANAPVSCSSVAEFAQHFGAVSFAVPLGFSVADFFDNGGTTAIVVPIAAASDLPGNRSARAGLYALDGVPVFNLLVIPPDTADGTVVPAVYAAAAAYCVERLAFLVCDPPAAWAAAVRQGKSSSLSTSDVGIPSGSDANAAVYFPRVMRRDGAGGVTAFPPSGAVAGVIARSDASRGVWRAAAGTSASIEGIQGLEVPLDLIQASSLTTHGINSLRTFAGTGTEVSGSRTIRGRNSGDEFCYIPVRRLAIYVEESIESGTAWTVFEPNAPPLWAKLRIAIETFLETVYRTGAFASRSIVHCDENTTTQADIAAGHVRVVVGIAPTHPNEFVILQFALQAGAAPAPGCCG